MTSWGTSQNILTHNAGFAAIFLIQREICYRRGCLRQIISTLRRVLQGQIPPESRWESPSGLEAGNTRAGFISSTGWEISSCLRMDAEKSTFGGTPPSG